MAEETDSDLQPPFAAEIGKDLFRRMISEELAKECELKEKRTKPSLTACQAEGFVSLPASEGTGAAEAFLRLPENQPASV